MRVTVLFDGGCSMKKGVAAGAAVLYDEAGVELARGSKFMSDRLDPDLDGAMLCDVSTPRAEYTALIVGLLLARSKGATSVRALGDAELVVRQVDGRYRCKDGVLQHYLRYVHGLMGLFDECVVEELPKAGPKNRRRYGNAEADAHASLTMKERRDLYE